MKSFRDGQRWAYDFLIGEYRGSPLDYVMAIAIVLAMMAVVVIRILSDVQMPDAMVSFAIPMIKLIHMVFFG